MPMTYVRTEKHREVLRAVLARTKARPDVKAKLGKWPRTKEHRDIARASLAKTLANPDIRARRLAAQIVATQRFHEQEEAVADELRQQGYVVYMPNAVCDRVVFKDGKVLFVECKRLGEHLRPGQDALRSALPEHFIVM